jgi:glycosyltransferase involved in cell wall biosynthesis
MRVAYICSDVDVQVFGHEGCSVHVREFTNALVEGGHETVIMCAWAGNGSREGAKAEAVPILPHGLAATAWRELERESLIADHHLERDLRSLLGNHWLLEQAAGVFDRSPPDFIYERYSLFGWAGVELARRYGVPLILELNAPLCRQQAGYEKFPLFRTAEVLEGEILRSADAVIALSDWLRDWSLSLGVESPRIHVIPDGVSEGLFGGELSGDVVRRRHKLEGKRVVGFVGSFHHWHDVKGLLEAFAGLHRTDPDLRLLLVGNGEQRPALEKSARDKGVAEAVVFTRNVPHHEVPLHIAAMDVTVVPYRPMDEFFFSPLKLFEYMAVGRPTVAAAIGQIQEVVEHGRTGLLYPPGDEARLADGIATLLRDPEEASRMGLAARRRVLQEYTWGAVTRKVTAIAAQLIAERKAGRE